MRGGEGDCCVVVVGAGAAGALTASHLVTGLSSRYRVALVPNMLEGFGERRDLFQPDGIHPTAEAQPAILDRIWPALRPLLK